MNCNKCKNEAVKNTANGKDFWFCRTCRDEVTEAQEVKTIDQKYLKAGFPPRLMTREEYEMTAEEELEYWSELAKGTV